MTEPTTVLVVAHQTAANDALLDEVRRRSSLGPTRFHLVVPQQPHGFDKLVNPHDAGASEAEAVLQDALPRLTEAAGSEVSGAVGDAEPLMAIQDALHAMAVGEIIISTLPLGFSRWMKLDLVSKARGLGVPVTHITSEVKSRTLVAH